MRRRYTTITLLILDVLCAIGVFNVALLARGLGRHDSLVLQPLFAPIAILLFAVYLIDGYSPRTDMLSVDYASQHVIAFLGALVATLLLTFVFVTAPYALQGSRLVLSLSFAGIAALTLGYRRAIHLRRLSSRGARALVFVGDAQSSALFREEYAKMVMYQPVVFATNTDPSADGAAGSVEAPRAFANLLGEIESGQVAVEAIILRESARDLAPGVSRRLVQLYFAGVPTYTLELFHQVYWRKIPIYRINPTWLFQEGFKIAREPAFERLKRASDIFLSGVGLTLGAPFIALGGIAVWLEDRGPVFFVQTRVGKNHVPFRLLKLRSMRVDAPRGDPYTRPGDARITRVGRLLRASRLDELPQLWNVLRGDMSLIGPRAEWDRLVESYERDIPCYHFRHLVKPGITGWAQVNYPYGANLEDTIRKLEYDLYYIRHFSFTLDAAIVLKTIHIMLFGKGR
ncbi:MAG: exopolysaccharide biosynthesis polyprenyl glycosylphosphotransferase [Verrucomicrobia bacterium]|nr:exopolysaccharide biosynthesis polyprenyl glycosylphosphotransferase [Verrucomicrobiota bacterium]